jgi:D-glycero-D-manno-heptose 1,7-bisphosphate phosphatase
MKRRALFLDRDGVINTDKGYVHKPEDFEFIEGIFDLVAYANRAEYLVVVVTNQAGIGRGYFSELDFHNLTIWMKDKFTEKGAKIDAVYFCPFHPEHGKGKYKRESDMRKPSPGMLFMAQSELAIDLKQSILIGDKSTDIAAGRTAGVGTLLLFQYANACSDKNVITRLSQALSYFSLLENEKIR